MALYTVGGIMTAIDDYLSRQGDFNVAYKSEYFISLAHARIHYGSDDPRFPSDPIRIRAMETQAVIDTSVHPVSGAVLQIVPLPERFLGARTVILLTDPYTPLVFFPPMDFWSKYVSTTTGKPLAYTIEGDYLILGPVPDAIYTVRILYWKALEGLAGVDDGNWIMAHVPGIYLYGSLLEAACVIQDDEQIMRYGPMFAGAVAGLIKSDKRDRFSGAPLVMRSASPTP